VNESRLGKSAYCPAPAKQFMLLRLDMRPSAICRGGNSWEDERERLASRIRSSRVRIPACISPASIFWPAVRREEGPLRGTPSIRCALLAFVFAMALGPIATSLGVYQPSAVEAWNPTNAANYADSHWNDCKDSDSYLSGIPFKGPYPQFSSDGFLCYGSPPGQDNCAAYASETLSAGGYSYVNLSGLDKWYWNLGNEQLRWTSTPNAFPSFYNATNLAYFLVVYDHDNHNGTGAGGGWVTRVDVAPGPSLLYDTLAKGDPIFMDFNGSTDQHWISHVRVEAGWYGPGVGPMVPYFQPSNNAYVWQGDYADNQSPGRLHDQWSGYYAVLGASGNPQNTVIWEVHIDSANI
jgi:hypothetical protein